MHIGKLHSFARLPQRDTPEIGRFSQKA